MLFVMVLTDKEELDLSGRLLRMLRSTGAIIYAEPRVFDKLPAELPLQLPRACSRVQRDGGRSLPRGCTTRG